VIFATKLMMQSAKPLEYVEDDSLLFKRENEVWGAEGSSAITVHIPNVRSGKNAFTYCGTVPLILGWVAKVMGAGPYLYRNKDGSVLWRNYNSSGNLSDVIQGSLDVQPYVAATLCFPNENTLTLTLSVDGSEKIEVTGAVSGNWNTSATDVDFRIANAERNTVMDLALVYNRVLTDEELLRNYKVFMQRHR
jgi:hypothetical protein